MRAPIPEHVRSAERALSVGTWLIVCGAMLYSVLTVTPLMGEHTPEGWGWTAPILPLVVDAAVVIVVRLDSVLARLGVSGGGWPVFLRWMTGLMTLGLNTADSALEGDLVGVAVHAVAPLLLIVTAETGLAYRRAIAAAVARIELEHREQQERERREHAAREQADREERERERAERERRENAAWEREREAREHAAQLERERLEREAQERREAREHTAELEREREERAWQRDREERQEREQTAQWERERQERESRERPARETLGADEHRESEARLVRAQTVHGQSPAVRNASVPPVHERREQPPAKTLEHSAEQREHRAEQTAQPDPITTADGKLPEAQAREVIRAGVAEGLSVRTLAGRSGWSVGWVSARVAEARATTGQASSELVAASA